MANSTWLSATNDTLALASLDQIADANTFNNGPLTKYQYACKSYIRLGNQHLGVRVIRHFSSRLIQLLLTQGVSDYALDTGISAEMIQPHSFYNSTPAPSDAFNTYLPNWKYEEYLSTVPRPSLIPQGAPQAWILLPIDRTQSSPVSMVRIYPVPNQQYTLQYKAKINALELTDADSVLLWPPEYEHALWEFAWNLLERDLGEGKEGMIAELADQAAKQVMLLSGAPGDIRKAPRMMRLPGWRRRGRC